MRTIEFDDPVFYDKKIQELNVLLEALDWIENQYPICQKGETEEGTFPEVYFNDGTEKNIQVLPEGSAVSFFQIEGDIIGNDEFDYEIPFSLTVWADLTEIHPEKSYDYTSELVSDVLGVLNDNSCYDLKIKTADALEDFTMLQKLLKQPQMRPYTAFKISFKCNLTKC